MNATAIPASTIDPLQRPRLVLDPFDAVGRDTRQRAATEGRLEPVGTYSIAGPSNRASYMAVLGGALGLIVFLLTVPLVASTYLTRTQQHAFQLDGIALPALILVNLFGGYLMLSLHEALHALACRLMRGQPVVTMTDRYLFTWAAPGQAFSRRSYLVMLLTPLVFFTLLWLIIFFSIPVVAAYLIVALVSNIALSGPDLFLANAARQQPPNAALYAHAATSFVTYAITATKQGKRKITTPIAKKKASPAVQR